MSENLHRCDNCMTVTRERDLVTPIPNLDERVDEDGPEPSGECPLCHALTYPLPFSNNYEKPTLLNIWVRADMLESVGGMAMPERELAFALEAADPDDADTLRWLAALLEQRISYLDGRA